MATIRRRSPAAAAISKSAIEKVGSTLQALPEKPREKLSLREAVSELQESITAALNRGYSYEEVVKILANQGVDITIASLKRYLAAARKENVDPSKGKRASGTRSRKTLSTEPAVVPPIAAVENNGAAKPSGTRTSSKKPAQAATESTPKRSQSRTSSSAKPAEEPSTRSRTAAKTKSTSKTTKTTPRSTASPRKPGKGKTT